MESTAHGQKQVSQGLREAIRPDVLPLSQGMRRSPGAFAESQSWKPEETLGNFPGPTPQTQGASWPWVL